MPAFYRIKVDYCYYPARAEELESVIPVAVGNVQDTDIKELVEKLQYLIESWEAENNPPK